MSPLHRVLKACEEFPMRGVYVGSAMRRFLIAAVVVCACCAYVRYIFDFLALHDPIGGEVVVVESWFPDDPSMREAADAVQTSKYRAVICVAVETSEPRPGIASNAERAA